MLSDVIAALAELPFAGVLLAAAALAVAESGLGLGMLVPGETGVLVLATTATDVVRFVALFAVVALGVCAGDHVGYGLGRRYGAGLGGTRLVRRLGTHHWDRAVAALHRHGAAAVLWTRLLPVVRTLTPAAAGVARVRYPRFLAASLAGSAMWAGLYVGVGALAGASIGYAERVLGRAGWVALVVLGITGFVLLRRRSRLGSVSSR